MLRLLWLTILVLVLVACATPRRPGETFEAPAADPKPALANAVAFRALSLVGTPYVYGGESPQTGFDCSGFVRYLYRDALGITLARTAQAQSEFGKSRYRFANLRLGDLVFFKEAGQVFHVGLYVGEGRFVHAPRTGKSVALSTLASGYWAARFALARRVL
jgi:cell wall-associated NlpC family hydrolase